MTPVEGHSPTDLIKGPVLAQFSSKI